MQKNSTVTYPRDTKDDTKIVSQKVTLSSEFMKNIESQNNFMECSAQEKIIKSGIPFFTLLAFLENFGRIGQRDLFCPLWVNRS